MMLTKRQNELLRFITDYQGKNDGVSPSFDEMMGALGIKSKSNVHHILEQLEKRSAIVRLKNCKRAIHIVGSDDETFETRLSDRCDTAINEFNKQVENLIRIYGKTLGHKVIAAELFKHKHLTPLSQEGEAA